MGIWSKRLPDYGVTLSVYVGRVTLKQIMRRIEAMDAAYTGRWLSYCDPTADFSAVDIVAIPEMKRLMALKLKKLHGGAPATSAVVCGPEIRDQFPRFWASYAASDRAYPSEPVAFSSLEAAFDWLGLPEAGRREVREAIASVRRRSAGSERARPPQAETAAPR